MLSNPIKLGDIMMKPTICISENVKSMLNKIKIHPRETYEDVITRLIKSSGIQMESQKEEQPEEKNISTEESAYAEDPKIYP